MDKVVDWSDKRQTLCNASKSKVLHIRKKKKKKKKKKLCECVWSELTQEWSRVRDVRAKYQKQKFVDLYSYREVYMRSEKTGGGPCGVMVKALDCGIVVSEFKLWQCYYIHFWINTLGKGINLIILPAMG